MNPKVVFWVPVAIRLGFLLAGAGLVWWWFGLAAGIVTAFAGVLAAVFIQLKYLYQLSEWLDKPESGRLPDGWGEWTNIFSRLYRLRRDDEKNQAELTEWLARFRQAMHLLPDGVVIMDDVLFLEWCNPAAEEHLGLQQARDKGMRVTNLVRSPDFMDYLILGRYDQPLTLNFRGRKLVAHIIPFENRRQILVTHDITETQRAEMMRRDFIANASHELRTPLTVIAGFLEIAASMELDAETRALTLATLAALTPEHRAAEEHVVFELGHPDVEQHRLAGLDDLSGREEQAAVPKRGLEPLEKLRAVLIAGNQNSHEGVRHY